MRSRKKMDIFDDPVILREFRFKYILKAYTLQKVSDYFSKDRIILD